MKVLLIEDNRTITRNIANYLKLDNWIVDTVYDGNSWLKSVQSGTYDILVLDYMIPWMDGIELTKAIRKMSGVPIIMITALDNKNHTIIGLESGVDDYMIKPFELKELSLRMTNIFKHRSVNMDTSVFFNDISINIRKRTIEKNGMKIHLFLKEFMILEYLLQRQGFPVSRADIIEYIWWGDSLFEKDKLDVYISGIRKKIDPKIIETIKWFGYIIHIH